MHHGSTGCETGREEKPRVRIIKSGLNTEKLMIERRYVKKPAGVSENENPPAKATSGASQIAGDKGTSC
jgi:hypothetical protein